MHLQNDAVTKNATSVKFYMVLIVDVYW